MNKRILSLVLSVLLTFALVLPSAADDDTAESKTSTATVADIIGKEATIATSPDQAKTEFIDTTGWDKQFLSALKEDEPYIFDGEKLVRTEVNRVTYLYLGDKGVNHLTGIEEFVALESLNVYKNKLTSIDVSKNPALINLDVGENALTTLDVSNNPALKYLFAYNNKLTSIDVSKNPALTELNVGDNALTSLDVSNNLAVKYLYVYNNKLTSIDMSKSPALISLDVSDNALTLLDVSNNSALEYLRAYNNKLTSIDVSKNPALTELYVGDNALTSLDVSNNPALEDLSAYNNKLTLIDVLKIPALIYLDVGLNTLTTLDVSHNPALKSLRAYDNKLTSIDVSKNPALNTLDVGDNALTSLDVSNNLAVKYLYVYNNKLTSLDMSKSPALIELDVSDNALRALNAKDLSLKYIYVSGNPLTLLDVRGNKLSSHNMVEGWEEITPALKLGTTFLFDPQGVKVANDNSNTQNNNSNNNGSSSGGNGGGSSSGGGGGGGGGSAPTVPQSMTSAQGEAAVKAAVNGVANLKNPAEVPLTAFKAMAKAAGDKGVQVNADTRTPDGRIDVRLSFNPADATKTINLAASTQNTLAASAKATFAKRFTNTLTALNLSQTGSLGMNVKVATKLDSALKNAEELMFYIYDAKTNKYTKLKTTYRVDKNGYVHFTTDMGGTVIISDGALKK